MPEQNHLNFDHFSFQHPHADFLYQDFSLTITKHRWLGILGPSGVGKTTLLYAMARRWFKDIPHLRISLLPQNLTLLPWLSNLDNVMLSDVLRGNVDVSCQLKAKHFLEQVGLHFISHLKPKQLSGGQGQRLIIARTLYENSDIILLDEPFAHLDAITKQEVQDCAYEHWRKKTVVLVTHDPLEALRLCDEIIVLEGQPVYYKNTLKLCSQAPRHLEDIDVRTYYPLLLQKLLYAKQPLPENT